MDQPVLVDFWAPGAALQGARPAAGKARGRLRRPLQAGQDRRRRAADRQQLSQCSACAASRLRPVEGGQPVDGFVGALPEGKIREFLDKHVPPPPRRDGRTRTTSTAEDCSPKATPRPRSTSLQAALAKSGQRHRALRLKAARPARAAASRGAQGLRAGGAATVLLDARLVAARPLDRGHGGGAEAAGPADTWTRRSPPTSATSTPASSGPSCTSPQREYRGDGRAARDPDARQGLEGRPRAQDLRRHPRSHDQAAPPARRGRAPKQAARSRRPARRPPVPPTR